MRFSDWLVWHDGAVGWVSDLSYKVVQLRQTTFLSRFYPYIFRELSFTGQSLVEAGESYRQLAEVKYSMEDNVKQNFLDPLAHIQNKDLKEVNVSAFSQ